MKTSILERLHWFKNRIDELGGFTQDFIVKEPATEEEIAQVEAQLGTKIPADFRNALLNISSHLEFYWNIFPDETQVLELPDELAEIFSGELHFGLDLLLDLEEDRNDWISECYPDYNDPYDKIYHNKLAFQKVGNGDFLAIDLEAETYGNIVYLSHDGSELHGYVMANSFTQFLDEYTRLGCVGGEDWQWETFTNNQITTIDSQCDNAKLWLKTIGRTEK